jgi:hypothetical protein
LPWPGNRGAADFHRLQTNGIAAAMIAGIAACCCYRLKAADLPVGEFRRISRYGGMLLTTTRVRCFSP